MAPLFHDIETGEPFCLARKGKRKPPVQLGVNNNTLFKRKEAPLYQKAPVQDIDVI